MLNIDSRSLLSHGRFVALLAIVLLSCWAAMPAQAQFDQEAKREARRKNIEIKNRSEALGAILRARAELEVYDRLMAVKPADQRDSGLLFELNDLRYSIIKKAIDAYIKHWNKTGRRFTWTKTTKEINGAVSRARSGYAL